jgi:ABC-type multidrug transport system ATPase subunit
LVHEPRILFLEEPTAGIDPVARRALWDLLFELAVGGVTLFITTHYMDEASRCTQLRYIYMSKLVACGTPAELRQLPEVSPSGSHWVEVAFTEAADALRGLKELGEAPQVQDATMWGETLHLLAASAFDQAAITARLAERGLTAALIREVEPSLEDVFFVLTRAREREAP